MKKILFIMMLMVTSLSFGSQAGIEEYRYTQGGVPLIEHMGNLSYAKGQAGYIEYSYTHSYSASLRDSSMENKMSRASYTPYITGQPGYDLYRYNQNGSTIR